MIHVSGRVGGYVEVGEDGTSNYVTFIKSMKVLSRYCSGIPLACTMKSKNDTNPPLHAGLLDCTPRTRYPTLSVSISLLLLFPIYLSYYSANTKQIIGFYRFSKVSVVTIDGWMDGWMDVLSAKQQ